MDVEQIKVKMEDATYGSTFKHYAGSLEDAIYYYGTYENAKRLADAAYWGECNKKLDELWNDYLIEASESEDDCADCSPEHRMKDFSLYLHVMDID